MHISHTTLIIRLLFTHSISKNAYWFRLFKKIVGRLFYLRFFIYVFDEQLRSFDKQNLPSLRFQILDAGEIQ